MSVGFYYCYFHHNPEKQKVPTGVYYFFVYKYLFIDNNHNGLSGRMQHDQYHS